MNRFHKQRLLFISLLVGCLAAATSLALYALQQNINLFYYPSQVVRGLAPANHKFRLGGIVEEKSLKRIPKSLKVSFLVTDNSHNIKVIYEGILPDLFREGQAVVVEGKLDSDGTLKASQVLAKHDEKYMPASVKNMLERAKHDT